MNGFYGKTYNYRYRTIGVCDYPALEGLYMIGYQVRGEYIRVKALPLFGSIDEAQKALDDFAKARCLMEVQE